MSERISTEAYIDQQFDDSALVAAIDMLSKLKRSYVERNIGKDAYDFYKLLEKDSITPLEAEDVTVDNLLYHSASDFIDTWVRATVTSYLPSHVSVCDIDDQSIMLSINTDHLPQYLNMYARFTFDAERTIDSSVYFYNRSPNASQADQILEGVYEMDGRSVLGVDIRSLQSDLALALIKSYGAWFDHEAEERLQ